MGEADGYRLGPVQKVRALDERVKQGDLAGAVGDARKTQATIDVAKARVEKLRAAIEAARTSLRERFARDFAPRATSSEQPTASMVVIAERYIARLRRDLDAALDELDRAQRAHRGQLEVVDNARMKLSRVRADKELVERHFARWRDEKRKLAERRED